MRRITSNPVERYVMTDAPESIRPADPKITLELSREVFGPALDAACRSAQGRGVV
jgi:hypothetical protein